MFTLFLGRHIEGLRRSTNVAAPYKAVFCTEYFDKYLNFGTTHGELPSFLIASMIQLILDFIH